jgi:uncharacterized protein YbjT (DUF2867 family)
MSKTALLFGSTGMIGSYLLEELLNSAEYSLVKVFVRKPLSMKHAKLKQIITDFHSLDQVAPEIKGDVLFSCLGTTMKNTPSKEGRRFIDFEIPVQLATLAHANQVPVFMIISSVGASDKASNFYLRTKGEMETAVSKSGVDQIVLVQPSFLLGNRNEVRSGEGLLTFVFRIIGPAFIGGWRKFRPIHGLDVARAMLAFVGKSKGVSVMQYNEIKKRG